MIFSLFVCLFVGWFVCFCGNMRRMLEYTFDPYNCCSASMASETNLLPLVCGKNIHASSHRRGRNASVLWQAFVL